MPTHFQRSENNIYPHTPTTSPQKTLGSYGTIALSAGNFTFPNFGTITICKKRTLAPAHPRLRQSGQGSDNVRGQGVYMLYRKTVGKASALGKRTSRSEAVRLVPIRLSTSGSVSYDTAYTHSAPVRLPLLL